MDKSDISELESYTRVQKLLEVVLECLNLKQFCKFATDYIWKNKTIAIKIDMGVKKIWNKTTEM